MLKNITVYGGGSFGTALGAHAARCCLNATVFLRNKLIAQEILLKKTNSKYLPDIILPANLKATINILDILDSDLIIVALPSNAFDDALNLLKSYKISPKTVLLVATKGFANNPIELLSTRIASVFPDNPIAFIGGPNLAHELSKGLLTSATIAATNIDLANKISCNFRTKSFITSASDDIITLQIAGAVKNVIAIKSGLNMAVNGGENAQAWFITGAIKEIQTLAEFFGHRVTNSNVFLEYGVIGDLMLTCYSKISRNVKFGYSFSKSSEKKHFLQSYPELVEGLEALKILVELMKRHKLILPIISSVALELFSCL